MPDSDAASLRRSADVRTRNLEDVVSFAYARAHAGAHRLRRRCTLGIDWRMFAGKVNPIDGPWVIAVRAIAMRHVGRQNKVLAGTYLLPHAVHFIEA